MKCSPAAMGIEIVTPRRALPWATLVLFKTAVISKIVTPFWRRSALTPGEPYGVVVEKFANTEEAREHIRSSQTQKNEAHAPRRSSRTEQKLLHPAEAHAPRRSPDIKQKP